MNRISIIDRCPTHGKIIYLSRREAITYAALNRIRYSGKKQIPYRCQDNERHWHLCTSMSGHQKKLRRQRSQTLSAWENEGGATACSDR